MRRSTTVSALVLAGALTVPAITYAQTTDASVERDQAVLADSDRENDNYGWLGLLGLAGLLGLRRSHREKDRHNTGTRQAI
jgi:MYXO-CTERM domain-containing protein